MCQRAAPFINSDLRSSWSSSRRWEYLLPHAIPPATFTAASQTPRPLDLLKAGLALAPLRELVLIQPLAHIFELMPADLALLRARVLCERPHTAACSDVQEARPTHPCRRARQRCLNERHVARVVVHRATLGRRQQLYARALAE